MRIRGRDDAYMVTTRTNDILHLYDLNYLTSDENEVIQLWTDLRS